MTRAPAPPRQPEPSLKAKVQGRNRYHYRAKDARGQTTEGYLEALTEAEARRTLLARFPALLELSGTPVPQPTRLKVKSASLVIFYRRFASMLAAGVTVHRSLEFLAESEDSKPLRTVLDTMVKTIQSGRGLSHAMAQAGVFNRVSIGLVLLGEQTGTLNEAISKLADLTEAEQRQSRALKAALTYPCVLFVAILVVAALFVLVLGPGDSGLFSMLGGDLPWPTRVLVGVSRVLRTPWMLLAILGGLALIATWSYLLYSANRSVRYAVHSWSLAMPVLGPVIEKTVTARMLYVLAAAVQVGVPAAQALEMAREVCTNEAIARRFDEAVLRFRAGVDLAEALQQERVFPPLVPAMISLGLETGKLDATMANLSRAYEEDVELALTTLTRLAEPILLGFGGILTGFLTLATLMPILEVVNHFA